MLLVHIGHCLGDPRAVRAQHRVDLVLRDELLVEAGRCLPIRCVIIDHEFNATPEHSAFLIRMLLAKKVTFTNVAPLYGGLSGESRGCADADRLLRQACERRPQAKAKAKANQPTIFDAEHSRDLSRPTAVKESNYQRPRLLCARGERPRCRAPGERDELAPPHGAFPPAETPGALTLSHSGRRPLCITANLAANVSWVKTSKAQSKQ